MLSEPVSFARLRDWAADRHTLDLSLPLGELPRVRALQVGSEAAAVHVRAILEFSRAAQGRPELTGTLVSRLRLQCQRCLRPVELPVDVTFALLCLADERELDELTVAEQRFDALVVDGPGLDLRTVIEDELLASLPLAPKHDDERVCAAGVTAAGAQPETLRPFAGLADMLGRSGAPDSGSD